MNRKLLTILFLLVVAVICFILFLSQSYPAVLVDWRPISLDSFNKDSAAALYYYQKLSEVYGADFVGPIDTPEFKMEVQRAVLDKLVENKIIEKELGKRLEGGDIDGIVEKKINEILKETGNNIEEKVKTIYGISMADFRKEILEPQARFEVLEGRFIIENNSESNFEEWLNSVKLQSKVTIFVPNFHWSEGKVAINEQ